MARPDPLRSGLAEKKGVQVAKVSQVAPGIYQIDTENDPKLSASCVYLVADGETTVIDTGPGMVIPQLVSALRQAGHEAASLSYIILTHIHLDHAGGVGALAQQAPRAKVVAHEQGARHLIDPSRLIAGTRAVFGEDFDKVYGPILPVPQSQVQAVKGGETLRLGTRELKIVDAPGHAAHHLCIFDTRARGLFCGEALGRRLPGVDMVTPGAAPPIFDIEQALDTVRRLKALDPALLLYAHHGAARDVDRLFDLAVKEINAYGEVILKGMKAGEGPAQIQARLDAYQRANPESAKLEREYLDSLNHDMIVPAYMAYFKKKGSA